MPWVLGACAPADPARDASLRLISDLGTPPPGTGATTCEVHGEGDRVAQLLVAAADDEDFPIPVQGGAAGFTFLVSSGDVALGVVAPGSGTLVVDGRAPVRVAWGAPDSSRVAPCLTGAAGFVAGAVIDGVVVGTCDAAPAAWSTRTRVSGCGTTTLADASGGFRLHIPVNASACRVRARCERWQQGDAMIHQIAAPWGPPVDRVSAGSGLTVRLPGAVVRRGGLGVVLVSTPLGPRVTEVLRTDGALRVGDVVTRVDGTDLAGLALAEVVRQLSGEPGDMREVHVSRGGAAEILSVPLVHYYSFSADSE